MKRYSETQNLLLLFNGVFSKKDSGAILTHDGKPLHIQYGQVSDFGTFDLAGQILCQYFQLKPDQIVLMNDPYCGGSLLTTLTLFIGVSLDSHRAKEEKADLILALRFPLKPKINFAKSIDEEGLRIPPTPIAEGDKLHDEIIEAISQHEQAPPEFKEKLLQKIQEVRFLAYKLRRSFEIFDISWSKNTIQRYFDDSLEIIKDYFIDFPINHHSTQVDFGKNDRLKLYTDFNGEYFTMNFQGSSAPGSFALTEAASFGACFGALVSIIDKPVPINWGSFRVLNVISPVGTFLSAKYPQPLFVGNTQGVSLIAFAAQRTLLEIWKNKKASLAFPFQSLIEMQFENGQHFFDAIDPGTGATVEGDGEEGIHIWSRSFLQLSIEELEKRFPIKVESYRSRQNSGGKGTSKGGPGLVKSYKLMAPAKVKWSVGHNFHVQNLEHINVGLEPSLLFSHQEVENEALPVLGERNFEAGTVLTLMTGGGFGYGNPKS